MNLRHIVLAIASLLLVAGAADAQAPTAPTARDGTDAIVLANHELTVTFQGKAPDLQVAPAAAPVASFGYRFAQLVEYRDLDSNGAPSPGEAVASLDLAESTGWEANLSEDATSATVALTLSAPVEVASGASGVVPTQVPAGAPELSLPDRAATVTLTFTVYSTDVSLLLGDDDATMPTTSVKVDLLVSQWPNLGGSETRLALLMDATGDVGVDQGVGNITGNATSVGALAWSTNATGETADGAAVDVPVTAKAMTSGEATTGLAFVYDAAGLAKLDHDATLGLASALAGELDAASTEGGVESIKDVPGAPVVAVLGLLAVAAVALRRR